MSKKAIFTCYKAKKSAMANRTYTDFSIVII